MRIKIPLNKDNYYFSHVTDRRGAKYYKAIFISFTPYKLHAVVRKEYYRCIMLHTLSGKIGHYYTHVSQSIVTRDGVRTRISRIHTLMKG